MSEKATKIISGADFRKEYKNIKPGAYLFFGNENFIKLHELQSIRKRICTDENFEAFNHFVFTRDNYSAEALYSAIIAMPMMSDYKLVELYELPFSEYRKKEDSDGFESALAAAAESDDTVFIIYTTPENFDPGDTKQPSAMMKLFLKYALPVEFAHETTGRIVQWVQKHFISDKIVAELAECSYLVELVGHDMTTLSGEIDKLCSYLHYKEREKLTRADIELVCPHNKEIGAFEFADAILDGNNEKAFYILGDMKLKNEPVPVILANIIKVYTDLYALKHYADAGISSDEAAKKTGIHKYVAKLRMGKARSCDYKMLEAVINLCSATDSQLKSSFVGDYLLLERLIVEAAQYRKRKIF